MAKEIERKWKIDPLHLDYLEGCEYYKIEQGYITNVVNKSVRVRKYGPHAFLTIKGETEGITRSEFEYRIPWEDAVEMFETMCGDHYIVKKRYLFKYHGHTLEVDVFEGNNEGLVLAEVEFKSVEEAEAFTPPAWFGEDVSEDSRYYNACLAKKSYKDILEDERWEGYECHGNCIHINSTSYCRDCGPDNYKYQPMGCHDDED